MKFPFLDRLRTKPLVEVVSRPPTASELAEALFSVPEVAQEFAQESFTRADIELALDDRGWLTPNARTFQELDPATRNIKIAQSRMYWTADPLAKQAVRLWTDYALGNGLSYHCDDTATMKQLDAFMKDRRNRRLTSSKGQRRSSNKLLIDGDLFLVFFRDGEDTPLMRYLDAIQIQEIITAEHDQEQILGYKRGDAKGQFHYYRDWAADESDLAKAKDLQTGKSITWESEGDPVVYHIAFDDLDKRGNGLLSTVLPWTREHRRFMESRVALTQALSKFAWKLTAKVGEKGIAAIQQRLQSSLSTTGFTGSPERNPPNAPAGTFVSNAGADMVPMPRATGAGDSESDSNQLKLMVCAGTGIFLHYFGDPSTGNLATATAMELPMLKMFSAYQQLWMDAWRDIFSVVLQEEPGEEQATVAIDMPPILADDLKKLGEFIGAATSVFPELKVEQVRRVMLTAMNVPDVGEVMDAADELKQQQDAQAEQDKKAKAELEKAKLNQPQPTPPQPAVSEESLRTFTEAVKDFSKGIERLAGVLTP